TCGRRADPASGGGRQRRGIGAVGRVGVTRIRAGRVRRPVTEVPAEPHGIAVWVERPGTRELHRERRQAVVRRHGHDGRWWRVTRESDATDLAGVDGEVVYVLVEPGLEVDRPVGAGRERGLAAGNEVVVRVDAQRPDPG